MQRCYYFFDIIIKKKLFKFVRFKNNKFKDFFRIRDIEKLKTTLHSKYSPLYSVKIKLLSLEYSLSDFYS